VTRALAAAVLTAGISLPLTHLVAHAAIDDEDEQLVTDSFVDEVDYQDVIDDFVPTSSYVAPCPDGLYHLLFQGEPVVDAYGNPICVTQSANGNPGETIPGQPGESGQASNSEGIEDPGGAGEIPYY
jgi:hypothetical protein